MSISSIWRRPSSKSCSFPMVFAGFASAPNSTRDNRTRRKPTVLSSRQVVQIPNWCIERGNFPLLCIVVFLSESTRQHAPVALHCWRHAMPRSIAKTIDSDGAPYGVIQDFVEFSLDWLAQETYTLTIDTDM